MTSTVVERQTASRPVPVVHSPAGRRQTRYFDTEVALIVIIALTVRVIQLDHTPHGDELNHILAARSLLENGTLELVPGGESYTRAWLFTYAVAGMFWWFGESLIVARLPAVIAGTALVLVVFLSVRAVAGRSAAWFAALVLCFSPISIYQSQQVRFYTLQALFFVIGAIAVYQMSLPQTRMPRRLVELAVISVISLSLALHFQVASTVGIGAVVLWAVLTRGPSALKSVSIGHRRWVIAGVLLAGVATGAVLFGARIVVPAIELFYYADAWADHERGNVRVYHWFLLEQYATIWTLFLLSFLVAASVRPRPILFCGLVFGTVFLVHSFAGWKGERYIFYVMPFLFAISGTAFSQVAAWVYQNLRNRIMTLLPTSRRQKQASIAAITLMTGALLFAVIGNGAASYSIRMIVRGDADGLFQHGQLGYPYRGESNWAAAARVLGPGVDSSAVVLASSELKSVYFLGRLDYDMAPERRTILGGMGPEGPISPKTGRPWLVDVRTLQRVMACYRSGIAVIEGSSWRRTPWGVDNATADYLEGHAHAVKLPETWRLLVFRWRQPIGPPPPEGCA